MIAAEVIPDHEKLRDGDGPAPRAAARRPERLIERLLGFDVKLRQYEQGKKFATRWPASAGIEGAQPRLDVARGCPADRRASCASPGDSGSSAPSRLRASAA